MTKKKPRYESRASSMAGSSTRLRSSAHPQGSSRLQTHRSHLRADARADRGPVAGAGEQAPTEGQFGTLTMRPAGLSNVAVKDLRTGEVTPVAFRPQRA
jgi:hypothetical protein